WARACISGADLFDTELVLRAERAGARVVDEPVIVEELRPSRTAMWTRVPATLRGLLRLRHGSAPPALASADAAIRIRALGTAQCVGGGARGRRRRRGATGRRIGRP